MRRRCPGPRQVHEHQRARTDGGGRPALHIHRRRVALMALGIPGSGVRIACGLRNRTRGLRFPPPAALRAAAGEIQTQVVPARRTPTLLLSPVSPNEMRSTRGGGPDTPKEHSVHQQARPERPHRDHPEPEVAGERRWEVDLGTPTGCREALRFLYPVPGHGKQRPSYRNLFCAGKRKSQDSPPWCTISGKEVHFTVSKKPDLFNQSCACPEHTPRLPGVRVLTHRWIVRRRGFPEPVWIVAAAPRDGISLCIEFPTSAHARPVADNPDRRLCKPLRRLHGGDLNALIVPPGQRPQHPQNPGREHAGEET